MNGNPARRRSVVTGIGAVTAAGTAVNLALVVASARNPWGATRFTLFDDAMISMSYARTLAETGSLVWFDGAPRVQGFTNPLWTLFMTLIHLLGFEGSTAALVVALTGVAVLSLLAWTAGSVVRSVLPTEAELVGSVTAATVFLLFPTSYWTLRGMEVGVVALAAVTLLRLNCGPGDARRVAQWGAPMTAIGGVLTRFDFVIVAVTMALVAFLWSNDPPRRRVAALTGVSAGAAAGASLLVQLAYYGSALPTTYTLKMSGTGLIERATRGTLASAEMIPAIFLSIVALVVVRRRNDSRSLIVSAAALAFLAMCAYSVYVGGDAWENDMPGRFHASVLPLVVVAASCAFGDRSVIRKLATLRWIVPIACSLGAVGAGVLVNPSGFALDRTVTVTIAVGMTTWAFWWASSRRVPRVRPASILPVVTAALLIVPASVSVQPFGRLMSQRDPLGARTNLWVTTNVETLTTVIDPAATVATVWAGVPAYYGRWKMIDLLGKNDPVIASSNPRAPFFPGHDKWDYDHSVRSLNPDVVFQVFSRDPTEDIPAKLAAWGYERLCLTTGKFSADGAWFLRRSPRVRHDLLTPCGT